MAGIATKVDALIRPDHGADADIHGVTSGRRTWTLIVACMGVALVVASMIALNTALGDIAVATSATQNQLTWVVDSYTLALACLLLPAGAIGDRYGRRAALLIGVAVFAAASVAPVFLSSPLEIIVSRAIAGVGAAFVMPATLSLLTVVYPKNARTKAVGIWAGVAGSGAVAGMLGSGLLLRYFSWQSIFLALAGVGSLLFVATLTVAESKDSQASPVDWLGAAIIGTAVAVFVFGVIEAPIHGWSDPVVSGCLAAGLVMAAVFGLVELRRRHPLLDVRLFGRPDFATGSAAVLSLFLANFGFFYVLMQYTQLVLGYSSLQTALAVSPLMGPLLIFSALSPWYLPRMGLRLVLFLALVIMAASFFCLLGLGLHSSYFELMWPLLMLATGIGLCTAPATAAIMGAVPDGKLGVASAVNDTARELGAALGIAIAGSILAAEYTRNLTPNLSVFPAPVRGSATSSLAEAVEVSNRLGRQGLKLAELSRDAFLQAMHSSLLVMGFVIAVVAVFIGVWAPGRDGRQLRPVRRLRSVRPTSAAEEFGHPVRHHDDAGVGTAAGDGWQH